MAAKKKPINFRLTGETLLDLDELTGRLGFADRTDTIETVVQVFLAATREIAESLDRRFTKEEWNYLADVLRGIRWYRDFDQLPGKLEMIAQGSRHRQPSANKWFGKNAETAVATLVEKLSTCDYLTAWAVLFAIQYRWNHEESSTGKASKWWLQAFASKDGREDIEDSLWNRWSDREPWVTADPEFNREWLHTDPPRYFLHQQTDGDWIVVDRWLDLAEGPPAKTRKLAIRHFYRSHGRKIPPGANLPQFPVPADSTNQ